MASFQILMFKHTTPVPSAWLHRERHFLYGRAPGLNPGTSAGSGPSTHRSSLHGYEMSKRRETLRWMPSFLSFHKRIDSTNMNCQSNLIVMVLLSPCSTDGGRAGGGLYLCKSQDPWKPLWRSMQGRYHEPLFSCCNLRTSNPPTAPPPVEDRPPPAPAHHRVAGQTWRHRRCHDCTGLLWVRRYGSLLAHQHCGPYTRYISTRSLKLYPKYDSVAEIQHIFIWNATNQHRSCIYTK